MNYPAPFKMTADGRGFDPRVRSSGPATFFRGDWSLDHCYGYYFPGAGSSRACQLLAKRCALSTG